MKSTVSPVSSLNERFLPPRAPAQILLAEDDLEMRSMIAAQLRDDGHEVIEAQDGRQLLTAAQRFQDALIPFDLLITDVRMPGWNGLEALDHLRRSGMDLPVIVMTAFGDPRLHAVAQDLGAALVLDKPFDLDDLSASVRRLLAAPEPPPVPSQIS